MGLQAKRKGYTMSNFYLPETYYDPPEAHETVVEVTDDDELSCGFTGDVDAYTWDGETYEFSCDCAADKHTVIREAYEPDYEAIAEAQAEAQSDW